MTNSAEKQLSLRRASKGIKVVTQFYNYTLITEQSLSKDTSQKQLMEILQYYPSERFFRMKEEEASSSSKETKTGVPQGSLLIPDLYLLCTSVIIQLEWETII